MLHSGHLNWVFPYEVQLPGPRVAVGCVIMLGMDEELPAEYPETVTGDGRSGGNLRQRWLIDGQEEGMYP